MHVIALIDKRVHGVAIGVHGLDDFDGLHVAEVIFAVPGSLGFGIVLSDLIGSLRRHFLSEAVLFASHHAQGIHGRLSFFLLSELNEFGNLSRSGR